MEQIQSRDLNSLRPHPRNARTHSKRQIHQIANSIEAFGFTVPLLIDRDGLIIAGHGRLAAAELLNLDQVPVIVVDGLSEAKKRALLLADNKIAENAGWDREMLAIELPDLADLLVQDELDISITGFEPVEIDQIVTDFEEESADPADDFDDAWVSDDVITRFGDCWQLGKHYLLCGDARNPSDLDRLLNGERVAMAFLDPPYNVRVKDIVGRGRVKHDEFAMASGEMSRGDFVAFLEATLSAAASVSQGGAVHYVCIDWRHVGELVQAGHGAYDEMLNLVVWTKSNAGQGSFYRSQHELIGVFRVGGGKHLNNVELGRHGRSRSNVWNYAGVNSFKKGRMEELSAHPTVKPVAMVADAMKDCTRRKDIVLDTFSGAGTTIMAAERVGRRAYALELEPRYVDVAVRRWEAFTGRDAVLQATGQTFDEAASERMKRAGASEESTKKSGSAA